MTTSEIGPPLLAWTLLYQAYTATFKTMERTLSPLGISPPQAFALAAIQLSDEPMTPGRLAGLLAQETQSLTGLVDRMEAQGWVERRRDLPDRRTIRLSLTEAGTRKLAEIMPVNQHAAEEIFTGLAPDTLHTLIEILNELRDSVLGRIGLDATRTRVWPSHGGVSASSR